MELYASAADRISQSSSPLMGKRLSTSHRHWSRYLLQKLLKKSYCYWKLKLLEHQEMPLKENGQLAQGQKCRVHIKCMEESTKKDDCVKKFKVLNNFFNTLQLSILYRNVNRKALKRLLFFDSVVFQQHILIISPQALHPGRLKSGINFALEPQWTYIWMGLYPDGSLLGILRHHIFVKSYVHFCISCYSLQTCILSY